ncbi:Clavesin-1 [Pseudolycoriella hygida]|uniref:Clavesin-1 n=1 Tax=Pseudolycoriella hygida TaxID=35572 RepID=A0A9Q0RZI6_9DIPT|nr:Clavesin-1 [Pseudolycoriella hygida]
MVLMMFDAHFTEYDEPSGEKIASGECFIFDAKAMSFRHFWNVVKNVSTLRLYLKYIQEAVPFNIVKVHFVNCSYIVDRLFALIKPLLSAELLQVMYFHTQGMESLYEHIPRTFLPTELGGELGPLSEIYKKFVEFVVSKRDYLMNDDNWKMTDC